MVGTRGVHCAVLIAADDKIIQLRMQIFSIIQKNYTL